MTEKITPLYDSECMLLYDDGVDRFTILTHMVNIIILDHDDFAQAFEFPQTLKQIENLPSYCKNLKSIEKYAQKYKNGFTNIVKLYSGFDKAFSAKKISQDVLTKLRIHFKDTTLPPESIRHQLTILELPWLSNEIEFEQEHPYLLRSCAYLKKFSDALTNYSKKSYNI